MELLACVDCGPAAEVRFLLVDWQGHLSLEIRVFQKTPTGADVAQSEGLRFPVEVVANLERAIRSVGDGLRRRGIAPERTGALPEGLGGGPRGTPAGRRSLPALGRWGVHQGRTEERVPLECPLEYAVRAQRQRGRTVDIGRGGLQVLLPERISTLNRLYVTLHLPGETLSVLCEVVWAERTQGMGPAQGYRHGLRFRDVGPHERDCLERLLTELGVPPG